MSARWTEEQYRELILRRRQEGTREAVSTAPMEQKRSKYGNHRTEIDGKRFDSKHEAEIYLRLLAMVNAGEIRVMMRQVPFDLPGGIRYIADFVTYDKDGNLHVYDAKSSATAKNRVYINKKKQMKAIWNVEIEEV